MLSTTSLACASWAISATGKPTRRSPAINRAAHAVITLKSEGVRTLAALEQRIAEAVEIEARLGDAAALAALGPAEPDLGTIWLGRAHQSRLAPASARNP